MSNNRFVKDQKMRYISVVVVNKVFHRKVAVLMKLMTKIHPTFFETYEKYSFC